VVIATNSQVAYDESACATNRDCASASGLSRVATRNVGKGFTAMKKLFQKVFSSVALAFFFAAGSLGFAADEIALTRAVDLQADAKEALAKKIPLVLFSNLTGCHYCRGALREVLLPMQRDAGWARTAIYRQIDADKKTPMKDFEGKATTHEAFVHKMKMQFTPTVAVVNTNGVALAEPIVGVATWDFTATTLKRPFERGSTLCKQRSNEPSNRPSRASPLVKTRQSSSLR
jgi:thioredoxin-related protein